MDPIPNIRFNVAKSLEVVSITINDNPEGLELSKKQIVPAIEVLRNDADADVRYFANKALLKANPTQGESVSIAWKLLGSSSSSIIATFWILFAAVVIYLVFVLLDRMQLILERKLGWLMEPIKYHSIQLYFVSALMSYMLKGCRT